MLQTEQILIHQSDLVILLWEQEMWADLGASLVAKLAVTSLVTLPPLSQKCLFLFELLFLRGNRKGEGRIAWEYNQILHNLVIHPRHQTITVNPWISYKPASAWEAEVCNFGDIAFQIYRVQQSRDRHQLRAEDFPIHWKITLYIFTHLKFLKKSVFASKLFASKERYCGGLLSLFCNIFFFNERSIFFFYPERIKFFFQPWGWSVHNFQILRMWTYMPDLMPFSCIRVETQRGSVLHEDPCFLYLFQKQNTEHKFHHPLTCLPQISFSL